MPNVSNAARCVAEQTTGIGRSPPSECDPPRPVANVRCKAEQSGSPIAGCAPARSAYAQPAM